MRGQPEKVLVARTGSLFERLATQWHQTLRLAVGKRGGHVLASIGALPFLAALLTFLFQSDTPLYPWADHALTEIGTRSASEGDQFLGPYSRFGWYHPGPAVFYALVPMYELFSEAAIGILAGAVVLNLLGVVALVMVVARWGGQTLSLWLSVLLAGFLATNTPTFVYDAWGPHIVVVPFALFMVLCAALASGSRLVLPALAVVGSFIVQTQLGASVGVIALLAVSALIRIVAARGKPRQSLRGPLIATVAALVVMWVLPFAEQVTHTPGNLRHLGAFFEQTPTEQLPWASVLSTVVAAMTAFLRGLYAFDLGMSPGGVAQALFGLQVVLLATGVIVAAKRRRTFATALCVLGLVAIIVGAEAIRQVRGPLYPYLIDWLTAAGPIGWIGVASALAPARWPPRLREAVVLALTVALLGLTTYNVYSTMQGDPTLRGFSSEEVGRLAVLAEGIAQKENARQVLLLVAGDDQRPVMTGVALELARLGRSVTLDRKWLYQFGAQFEPRSRPDLVLVIARAKKPSFPPALGESRLLVERRRSSG